MISFIERVFIHTNIKNKVMIKNSMLLLLFIDMAIFQLNNE